MNNLKNRKRILNTECFKTRSNNPIWKLLTSWQKQLVLEASHPIEWLEHGNFSFQNYVEFIFLINPLDGESINCAVTKTRNFGFIQQYGFGILGYDLGESVDYAASEFSLLR